jgi:hypothetical protein
MCSLTDAALALEGLAGRIEKHLMVKQASESLKGLGVTPDTLNALLTNDATLNAEALKLASEIVGSPMSYGTPQESANEDVAGGRYASYDQKMISGNF